MALTQCDLDQFTASDNWYQHSMVRNVTYTDGARYLAEKAGAYWLLDIIAIAQRHSARVAREEFQVWKLVVREPGTFKTYKATVTCDDGNGTVVYTQRIPYTDFPLPEVKLYFENGVICLPSER